MPFLRDSSVVTVEEIRGSGKQPWALNDTALKSIRDTHEKPRGFPMVDKVDLTQMYTYEVLTLNRIKNENYEMVEPWQPWSWRKMLNGLADELLANIVGDGIKSFWCAPIGKSYDHKRQRALRAHSIPFDKEAPMPVWDFVALRVDNTLIRFHTNAKDKKISTADEAFQYETTGPVSGPGKSDGRGTFQRMLRGMYNQSGWGGKGEGKSAGEGKGGDSGASAAGGGAANAGSDAASDASTVVTGKGKGGAPPAVAGKGKCKLAGNAKGPKFPKVAAQPAVAGQATVPERKGCASYYGPGCLADAIGLGPDPPTGALKRQVSFGDTSFHGGATPIAMTLKEECTAAGSSAPSSAVAEAVMGPPVHEVAVHGTTDAVSVGQTVPQTPDGIPIAMPDSSELWVRWELLRQDVA